MSTPIPNGLYWPFSERRTFAGGATATIDATGELFAQIGNLYIDGRPTASKTINTTGSSSIGFMTSTRTFVNVSSILDIGIQGVGTGGPQARPDGVFTVKKRMIGGTDTFLNIAWNEKTPDSGTATLTHGQAIAVVFDFNTRAGADSVIFTPSNISHGVAGASYPITNAFAAAAWGAAGSGAVPNVMLTFSDGTLGWIDGIAYVGAILTTTWTDATNPDEVGMIFRVPVDCTIDALWTGIRTVDATSDYTLTLYSDAEGTPTILKAITVDADQTGTVALVQYAAYNFTPEISLSAGVDYCIAVKATGAGNIRFDGTTLGLAAHRAVFAGTTNLRRVTRNASTGVFGSSSSVIMYPMGVRISAIEAGGGGGGMRLAGHGGLAA